MHQTTPNKPNQHHKHNYQQTKQQQNSQQPPNVKAAQHNFPKPAIRLNHYSTNHT